MGDRYWFAFPLVRQTNNYPYEDTEADLTPSEFFYWSGFGRSCKGCFYFDLFNFCGRCRRVQQGNGGLGIYSPDVQTDTGRRR
ncbi:MAG TPA: hypothetical protein DCQ92_13845 [Verrucomicrobia subdivision 3 bacterium]|nr:hypothetical protein [Limisphaerales bacterium]